MIPTKLVESIAELVCTSMKLSLRFFEFISPKECKSFNDHNVCEGKENARKL